MSNPKNKPNCKPSIKPTKYDPMNNQTTHYMNAQTEVPLQQLVTYTNGSQQLVPSAKSEGAALTLKTDHKFLPSLCSMNNLQQC
jgi:hypothetical protein